LVNEVMHGIAEEKRIEMDSESGIRPASAGASILPTSRSEELTMNPKTIITRVNLTHCRDTLNKAFLFPASENPEPDLVDSVPANSRVMRVVKVADPPVSVKV
jgi:hypothetical protein